MFCLRLWRVFTIYIGLIALFGHFYQSYVSRFVYQLSAWLDYPSFLTRSSLLFRFGNCLFGICIIAFTIRYRTILLPHATPPSLETLCITWVNCNILWFPFFFSTFAVSLFFLFCCSERGRKFMPAMEYPFTRSAWLLVCLSAWHRPGIIIILPQETWNAGSHSRSRQCSYGMRALGIQLSNSYWGFLEMVICIYYAKKRTFWMWKWSSYNARLFYNHYP